MKPRPIFRRVLRLAVGAAAVGLGVVLVLTFLEDRLLFHPVRHTEEWLAPPDERVQDVWLEAGGRRLHGWWLTPADWRPADGAMLYCPGNAGNLSHRGEAIAAWQREMGGAVLIVDYPGYGQSEGRPSEKGCYAAGEAAYDWLVNAKQVPPDRLILFGRSLGSGVATYLASKHPHRALVLVCAFTSVPDMAAELFPWLPLRWLVRNCFDNLGRIGQCAGPVFIAHSTADRVVPFAHGEKLFAAAGDPKAFFPMPEADHNVALGPEFYQALRGFLARAGEVDR